MRFLFLQLKCILIRAVFQHFLADTAQQLRAPGDPDADPPEIRFLARRAASQKRNSRP
jgi:hypothetical protein